MLIGSVSFANVTNLKKTSNEVKNVEVVSETSPAIIVFKTCQYNIYNSRGEKVGEVEVTDVPNNRDCASKEMKDYALDQWNKR